MVMNTYFKSILRSVKSNLSRFISIIVVMLLGIAFVAGLFTLSPSIKDSFSAQLNRDNFADVTVKSTAADGRGITQADVEKLLALDCVDSVETLTVVDGILEEKNTRIYVYKDFDTKINPLQLQEGRFPEAFGEVAVERKSNYVEAYAVGDEITVYGMLCKVVGVVGNPRIFDVFGEPDMIHQDNLERIIYFDRDFCPLPLPVTDAYVRFSGMTDRAFFSEEYFDGVNAVTAELESVLGTENFKFLTVKDNKSYAALDSYCDKVSVITLIFPLFFIAVSSLVVMTTVSRMVEEERGVLGCLKSLGFSDGKIVLKYVFLTGICSIFAATVGFAVGLTLLPAVLYPAFETMFHMPPFSGNLYPLGGILAFIGMTAVVLGVAAWVAKSALKEKPAELLIAKAPKAGKKIWLEYLPWLWKRLSFKYKSSIRNIFRYKKHLWMTVISVAGATALAFAGFAILNVADALAVDGGSFVGMRDSISAIAWVVVAFGLLLCVFVIYNLVNLNVGERKREIATLEVLGYNGAEILGYIYREIILMAIVGAIFGLGLGMGLIEFVLYYLEFGSLADVKWTSYLLSFSFVILFVVAADFLLARKILSIDMTTSLKAND